MRIESLKIPQLSIRATLLVIIGILNVLIAILASSSVYHSLVNFRNAQSLTQGSANISLLYKASKFLSLERAASLSVMYAEDDTAALLRNYIATDRKEADAAIEQALARITAEPSSEDFTKLVSGIREKFSDLQKIRGALDANMSKPQPDRDSKLPDLIFDSDTALVMAIKDLIVNYGQPLRSIDATVTQQMMFKYFMWEITEYAGREYAVIGRLIVENKPVTPEIQNSLMAWRSIIRHEWEVSAQFMSGNGVDEAIKPYMDEAETHYFLTFNQIKSIFYTPESLSPDASYPLSIEMWLEFGSQAVDSLLAVKDASLQETQKYVDRMEGDARHGIAINILLFICAGAISLYCLAIIIWRVIRPVNAMVDALYSAAQGKPHGPLPYAHSNDEIGKLGNVLEAFQANALKIEQSNEELERYAYITAHDLKSPLRAIDNLSQWIEEDLGQALTGKTREHMDTLRKRVRRMEKLLNDTLQYSRIDKKIEQAGNDVMNGKALVDDAVSLSAPPPAFTIKVSERFAGVELVRLPLQQIFYNLINNAIKHHDRETGTIEIDLREEPEHYVFSIRDDGPGIPRQYHEKVFEMFQTLKPRDQKEGSGMGLAIVRKILTTYGGEITLESEPGHGCLFRFTWPKSDKENKNAQRHYA